MHSPQNALMAVFRLVETQERLRMPFHDVGQVASLPARLAAILSLNSMFSVGIGFRGCWL